MCCPAKNRKIGMLSRFQKSHGSKIQFNLLWDFCALTKKIAEDVFLGQNFSAQNCKDLPKSWLRGLNIKRQVVVLFSGVGNSWLLGVGTSYPAVLWYSNDKLPPLNLVLNWGIQSSSLKQKVTGLTGWRFRKLVLVSKGGVHAEEIPFSKGPFQKEIPLPNHHFLGPG